MLDAYSQGIQSARDDAAQVRDAIDFVAALRRSTPSRPFARAAAKPARGRPAAPRHLPFPWPVADADRS